jgi:hypothetical protein
VTLHINIKMDNAAFEPNPLPEAARILRKLAEAMETYTAVPYQDWVLQDVNGNTVGTATVG